MKTVIVLSVVNTIGKYLTLRELCECTETYQRFKDEISVLPAQPESIEALKELAEHVIDPVIDHYGRDRFQLVYGFCSHDLRKRLQRKNPETGKPYGRVAPCLDQHIALETDKNGEPYCKRLGSACDFKISGENTRDVIRWMIESKLPFDRLYFFGPDRAVHVSYGPEHNRYICGFNSANVPEQKSVADLVSLANEMYRS